MKKLISHLPVFVSYFFVLLFCYAAISKMLDFENFQIQIGQSPLLSAYAGVVSYGVIIAEIAIVLLLIIRSTRLYGLYLSTALMTAFTVYIYLILNYSEFIPCSCGGILEKLSWNQHLIFNVLCVVLGLLSTFMYEKNRFFPYKTTMINIVLNLFSAAMVVLMFINSEHIIKRENNFTRRFLQFPVVEDQSINLINDRFYFAGDENNNIYLGNHYNPLIISTANKKTLMVTEMKSEPDHMNFPFRNMMLEVKAPYYYLTDGTVPVIFRGKIGDTKADMISYNDAFFSQIKIMDSLKFALRTQSNQTKQLTIATLNLASQHKVNFHPDILQKQIDGVFDSDGQFIYSKNPERWIYMYSYRNQLMVLDEKMHLTNIVKTIDTTTVAKIKTTKMKDGLYKMAEPPMIVNKRITAYGNLAFIQSNLKGRFEKEESWKKSSIIDIYRTDRQEYIGSFYIDKKKGIGLTDMMMTDRHLYVIIGKQLIRYTYRKPLTEILQGKPKT
ncbi:tellurium resistance protein TerC [Chryseobacterium sp. Leaf405]|uniref:MauE/DoxX family redox-associated membrane protein n=1 Tax=Chryseobacterium sp. Leaf405 TaxID=1736367 RepID=UPI0006FDADA7|nr:MauE/DoxX family redox-associated membrane protein [Chryseobacterium sp. Leaf405]KQT24780.1 tellurium resistance protein TerC [Chryseobacterium sp. Leaf405]